MEFVYEKAMEKVQGDMTKLVEEMYPKAISDGTYSPPMQEKDKKGFVAVAYPDRNSAIMQRYYMLDFLGHEKYWSAGQGWKESFRNLTEDDKAVYKNLMVHQAIKHAKSSERNNLEYAWLVENYDNGLLKDVISEAELKQFVNLGFMDMANYAGSSTGYLSAKDSPEMKRRFRAMMNHAELLDPKLLNFNGSDSFSWIDGRYADFFEKNVRGKMFFKDTAKMAFPIVSKIIEEGYDIDKMLETDDVKIKLKPYKEAFKSKTAHDFLISEVISFMNFNMVDSEYTEMCYKDFIDFVSEYIEFSKDDMKRIIKSVEPNGISLLPLNDFPEYSIDDEVISLFSKKFVENVKDAHRYMPREDVPYLDIINLALKRGLLDNFSKEALGKIITDDVNQMATKGKTRKIKSLSKKLEPWTIDIINYQAS